MASDTPSWLSGGGGGGDSGGGLDSGVASASGPMAGTMDNSKSASSSNNRSSSLVGTDPDMDDDLPSVVLMMRLLNMGVSIALVACSVLVMIGLPSISNWVLSIYATCGGLLVCCLETQLKFLRVMIAVNFGFLFHAVYRFLFYCMMGSVAWAYDTLFGKVVAGCLLGVACFNTYVLIRYPGYRRVREKIAEEEDKRIEARISQEVKKQAMNQFMGGGGGNNTTGGGGAPHQS